MTRGGAALERLRGWMGAEGVATLFVSDPVSVAYLTGFRTEPHERLLALVVREAEAALIVPGLDEESARAAAAGVEVLAWRDGEDPWEVVRAVVGASSGRLAVEKEHLRLAAWERLDSIAGGGGAPADVTTPIRAMRVRKDSEEIGRLERAAQITDEVTERLLSRLAAGQSELEMASAVALQVAEAGAQLAFDTIVQSGPNSAQPHLPPTGRRVERGELLLLDFGAAWEGYRADITRMAVIGEPDARQREVHAVVLAAHDAAIAAIRPGAAVGAVDAAAREVIRGAGLGDSFIHRTGHGLGLEAHEDPSLDPGSRLALEEGMVVTIEPGVYIPGWGGVRIEDDVVVEAAGPRLLTQADRSLAVVGAA